MTKHTPGPWEVQVRQHVFVHANPEHHRGPLAEMRGNLNYPATDMRVDDAKDANARLIAAAPELLEALNGCITTLPHIVETVPAEWKRIIKYRLEECRAAKAKAEEKSEHEIRDFADKAIFEEVVETDD